MGTYLMTGLKIKVSISCKPEEEKEHQKKLADIWEMKAVPEGIYQIRREEDSLIYEIDEEILKQELIPFLKAFYHAYYGEDANNRYHAALNFLQSNPYESWHGYFEDGDSYECCYENIGLFFDSTLGYPDICLLRLSFEGKVLAEEMQDHLNLYNFALRRAFPFKLSNALHTDMV